MVMLYQSTSTTFLCCFCLSVKLLSLQTEAWINMFPAAAPRRLQSWAVVCLRGVSAWSHTGTESLRVGLTGRAGSRTTSLSVCAVSNTWCSRLSLSPHQTQWRQTHGGNLLMLRGMPIRFVFPSRCLSRLVSLLSICPLSFAPLHLHCSLLSPHIFSPGLFLSFFPLQLSFLLFLCLKRSLQHLHWYTLPPPHPQPLRSGFTSHRLLLPLSSSLSGRFCLFIIYGKAAV